MSGELESPSTFVSLSLADSDQPLFLAQNIFVNNRQLNPGRNSMLSASSTDCCRKNDTTPSFGQTLQIITNFPMAPPLTQLAGEAGQFFHGDRLLLCLISHDRTSRPGSLFTFIAGSLSPDVERKPVQTLRAPHCPMQGLVQRRIPKTNTSQLTFRTSR